MEVVITLWAGGVASGEAAAFSVCSWTETGLMIHVRGTICFIFILSSLCPVRLEFLLLFLLHVITR